MVTCEGDGGKEMIIEPKQTYDCIGIVQRRHTVSLYWNLSCRIELVQEAGDFDSNKEVQNASRENFEESWSITSNVLQKHFDILQHFGQATINCDVGHFRQKAMRTLRDMRCIVNQIISRRTRRKTQRRIQKLWLVAGMAAKQPGLKPKQAIVFMVGRRGSTPRLQRKTTKS